MPRHHAHERAVANSERDFILGEPGGNRTVLVHDGCLEVVHYSICLIKVILRRLGPVRKIEGSIRAAPDAGRTAPLTSR